MQRGTWRRWVMTGVLAVHVAVLPIAAPLEAQQPGPVQRDTRTTNTDAQGFPWGLLGLLGLFGLAGLRRPPAARTMANDPTSRRP
jgi:MYXO-CTERM domain-containing protein